MTIKGMARSYSHIITGSALGMNNVGRILHSIMVFYP